MEIVLRWKGGNQVLSKTTGWLLWVWSGFVGCHNTYLYGWNHFAYITIIFSFILKHFSDIRIFIIAYYYNLFCTLIIICKLFVVSSVFKLGINFLSYCIFYSPILYYTISLTLTRTMILNKSFGILSGLW